MGPINGISELIGQHGFARDGLDQTSSADGPENLRKNRHDREGADVGPREQACQKDKDDEGEELVRHETHDRPADRMLALPPQICVKSCAKRSEEHTSELQSLMRI